MKDDKALQVFDFNDKTVRVIMRDGEPWWIAKDVADILGFRDAFNAIRLLDEDEKDTQKVSTPGGEQEMSVINESGLYSLIFRSNKPAAKKFRRWVTHEVLPQIRKTGMYAMNNVIKQLSSEVDELHKKIDEMYPLQLLGTMVLAQKGSMTFQGAAQLLSQHGIETGQNRLFQYCRDKKLLCSRKGRQWNKPTQKAIDKGLLNLEISGGFNSITVVTPEGMKYLANELGSEQYPLLMLIAHKD
ncbi:MAG: phage antirepressor [Synergistaceae bacterium]|nr:phage antirepressor [Synergistaceae bacterium]